MGPGSRAAEALRVSVVQAGECTSREAIGVECEWGGPGLPGSRAVGLQGLLSEGARKWKGRWVYSGEPFPFRQLLEKVLGGSGNEKRL